MGPADSTARSWRPSLGSSAFGEHRLEAIPGLDRAADHAGRHGTVDRLGRPYVRGGRDLRSTAEILEDEGFGAALRSDAVDVEHEGPGERLGRVDLQVFPEERHVLTIESVTDVPPGAARPDVHLDDRGRGALGPPPAGDAVRVRERLPDRLARRVEGALEHEVATLRVDRRAVGTAPVDPRRAHRCLHPIYSRASCVSRRYASSRSKLSSQWRRYGSTQSAMSRSGPARSRRGRHCACRPCSMSPARSSTRRCLEMAGWLMSKGADRSFTDCLLYTSDAADEEDSVDLGG